MNPKILIILVTFLMMCCCSSSSAFFLIPSGSDEKEGGEEGDDEEESYPSGRYVKLVASAAQDSTATRDDGTTGNVDDTNEILNLAELEVFAPGGTTNIAAGQTVTGSSEYSATHGYVNLVDGNMTNFAHTKGRTATEYDFLQVDLGSVQEIGKIKITNRTSCCKNRAIGVKAVILAGDGTTVVKETPSITNKAATYTFTFPGTAWA